MKNFPLSIQSFEKLITDNYIYVDKTPLIYKLIASSGAYFLSRPRRFGKSLLLSTMSEIFGGNKELFKDCFIYSSEYSWEQYPIVGIDFAAPGVPVENPMELENWLKRRLQKIAHSYDLSIEMPTLGEGLEDLIEKLSKKNKVVVLIDEYDRPITHNLTNMELAKANSKVMQELFISLKNLDRYLRFVFVTGVSKFAQVSLYSGFNNLTDITMSPTYSALVGYTEKELIEYGGEHLKRAADILGETESEVLAIIRDWYNGYRFSLDETRVYNPHSTMRFLQEPQPVNFNYWFNTSTPDYLLKYVEQQENSINELSGFEVSSHFFGVARMEKLSLPSLMWETGYLTIHNYNPKNKKFFLDYPNEEVKISFLYCLLQQMTGAPEKEASQAMEYGQKCKAALMQDDLHAFFNMLKHFFASIPYDMKVTEEKYYQTIFYVIAMLIGLEAFPEEKTNRGRIDMVVPMKKTIYIFEFKMDQSADSALQQIEDMRYYESYQSRGKPLVLVGVNFSRKERTITEWKERALT